MAGSVAADSRSNGDTSSAFNRPGDFHPQQPSGKPAKYEGRLYLGRRPVVLP